MVTTLENIRNLAKLNLKDDCFQVYLAIIEPNIKSMMESYFKDWQGIEVYVRLLYLIYNGVYRKIPGPYIVDIEKGETPEMFRENITDMTLFKKLYWRSFSRMLRELYEEKAIGPNLYELLSILNRRRNQIHRYGIGLTDYDRLNFHTANSLLFYFVFMTYPHIDKDKDITRKTIEDNALQLTEKIKSKMQRDH
ncbi:MAG: hypothetical protein DA330_06595 [Nitrososphaera sp.]|nr:hypothetical protein [Nitrososphaera sp.]